jgi:hypothetical protein
MKPYYRRQIVLHLIVINLILLGILSTTMALERYVNSPPDWIESPLLPDGLRTGMLNLVPGFSGVSDNGIRYTINSHGFRDDPIMMDKQHVLFVGDSTTFGLNIAHKHTFAEIWEQSVSDKWQAINAAAPGHGTVTEYALLNTLYADGFHPEWVVVGYYATNPANGIWDNTTWDMSKKYLKLIRILTTENESKLLIVYLPRSKDEIYGASVARDTIADFARQEQIPFLDGTNIYRMYMDMHQLTQIPDGFYSVIKPDGEGDIGHPGILASHLLGQAIAEVIH